MNPLPDLTQVDDTWEGLCDAGRAAMDAGDTFHWYVGDLAGRVETAYGEDAVGKFAVEIGLRKRTCYEYRQVAGFYEKCARAHFLNLRYSHFRAAMRYALRLEADASTALALLAEASDSGWTPEGIELEIKRRLEAIDPPLKPERLVTTGRIIQAADHRLLLQLPTVDVKTVNAWLKAGTSMVQITLVQEVQHE